MYFIRSTELTPTIDINPTLLQGVAKSIWQQRCRVYVNCRGQFCRAYEVHSQHLASVLFSHVFKPTSLFHLEEMFLLSLVHKLMMMLMNDDDALHYSSNFPNFLK